MGVPPFWAAGVVAQAIKAFRPRRPELRLQVFDSDSATTLPKVESGELDMALGFFFKHVPGIRRLHCFVFLSWRLEQIQRVIPRRVALRGRR